MAKMTSKPSGGGSTEQGRRIAQQCFARAREALSRGNYDYAIQLLKDACKNAPDQLLYRQLLRISARKKWGDNKRGSRMAAVTTMRARTALRAAKAKKQYHRALECCEDILAENPWDQGILLEVAQICQQLGWLDMAISNAETAMEKDPADPTVNRALALYYEKRGDFTKAIGCWERVKKAKPGDSEADRRMKELAASATINRGGYDEADSFVQSIADRAKTQELLDESKGGEAPLARQAEKLQRQIQDNPGELSSYLELAQLLRRQGNWDEATALMHRALEATGNNPEAQSELEDIEIERRKNDLAIARRQLASNSEDPAAKQKEQELARTLNDFELRAYQRRSERTPTDLSLRVELGIRLARAGLYDQAIPELQRARGEPRRKSEVLTWIGHCFRAKKNVRMAKRHYEEALSALDDTDQQGLKELHYLLGRLSENTGDKEGAVKHYEELISLDYEYRDAARRLDALTTTEEEAPRA